MDQITFLFLKYPYYHGYKYIPQSSKIFFFQLFLLRLTNIQFGIQLFVLNFLFAVLLESNRTQFKLLYLILNRYAKTSPVKGLLLSLSIIFYLLYGYWTSALIFFAILVFDSVVSCKLFTNFFVLVFENGILSTHLFFALLVSRFVEWIVSLILPWSQYTIQVLNVLECYYLFSSTILVLAILVKIRNNVVCLVKMFRNKRIWEYNVRQLFKQVMNSSVLLSMLSSCDHMIGEGAGCELCTLSTADANKSGTSSWSSGNPEIDRIISNSQSKSRFMFSHVEWIPFERLGDLSRISRGGFGDVYSAWWVDGPMCFYGSERIGGRQLVAIKSLGRELTPDLLHKLETYINVSTSQTNLRYELLGLFQCYGITQNPSTSEYCLVMDYAKNQDLRNNLNNHYKKMDWISDKLQILGNLARGLKLIHGEGLVHGDLHSGNVLIGDDGVASITDHILSRACVAENGSKGMYGVLPFVAPEILQGRPYTTSSDVYSFGILMWTLTSGLAPLSNFEFTTALAVDICDGERPEVVEGTPKCYADFMKKCWDSDPKKRPTADDICELVYDWYFLNKDYEQFKNSDNERINNEQNSAKSEKSKKAIAVEKFYSQFIDLEAISKVERFEEMDELWEAQS